MCRRGQKADCVRCTMDDKGVGGCCALELDQGATGCKRRTKGIGISTRAWEPLRHVGSVLFCHEADD